MKKIVYIGGGGGCINVLPGLRDSYDISAIITTFDDGGSYGRLRRDYKSPLSGDVRRALSALASNKLGQWTEYRFPDGDVKGHTLGNLMITAMNDHLADPQKTMAMLHELFKVKGTVLPVSYDLCELQAELKDRSIIRGESSIDEPHAKSYVGIKRVWLDPDPVAAPGVIESIKEADAIIMGPGDIFTSIIPCLLVPGVKEAISASQAPLIYFCNSFTKYGQTNRFTVFDHARALEHYLESQRISTIVFNTSQIAPEVINHHEEHQEQLVECDDVTLKEQGYSVHKADLLDNFIYEKPSSDGLKRSIIKYDPEKLLRVVQDLLI